MDNPLSLPAELCVYTVSELRPQWLAWLSQAPDADAPMPHPDAWLADMQRQYTMHDQHLGSR